MRLRHLENLRDLTLSESPDESEMHDSSVTRIQAVECGCQHDPGVRCLLGRRFGARAALEAGVGAVFVFPMHIGAAAFGVLALYYDGATTLDHEQMNLGLSFAASAADLLLDSPADGAGEALGLDHQSAQEFRSQVYQAQGMVMVSLGVSLAEALARMRAHAFANGQDLAALSAAIVAGTTRLPNDRC